MKILDEADIERMAEELAAVATTPMMLGALQSIHDVPPESRAAQATKVASVEYLKSQGLVPPETLRVSPRWFEPPEMAPATATGETELFVEFENGVLTVVDQDWVVRIEET